MAKKGTNAINIKITPYSDQAKPAKVPPATAAKSEKCLCERYRCIKSASEFRNLPPKAAFCPQIYHFFMNQANALCAEEVSD